MKEVMIASSEKARTVSPNLPPRSRSAVSGSNVCPAAAAAAAAAAESGGSDPRMTASHAQNMAAGRADPSRMAVRTLCMSQPSWYEMVGMTLWKTSARTSTGMAGSTAGTSARSSSSGFTCGL
eukprot:scaffold19092_cov90-Isochrysis_galbana.AAC.1